MDFTVEVRSLKVNREIGFLFGVEIDLIVIPTPFYKVRKFLLEFISNIPSIALFYRKHQYSSHLTNLA